MEHSLHGSDMFAMSDIPGFYRDKVVLLTGVTGFIGKCILWKLMKSCPDVKKIYLMVRPKKNTKPQDRLNREVFTLPIF